MNEQDKNNIDSMKPTGEGAANYGWDESVGCSLREKLKKDLKQALRDKNDDLKSTIRQIMSEFPKLTVPITLESGKKSTRLKKDEEISDEDIQGIIAGLIKSEKTTLELQKKASSAYLEILSAYLPPNASDEEITNWIDANIDFAMLKSPMQAVGLVMKHFGRKADGAQVKKLLTAR